MDLSAARKHWPHLVFFEDYQGVPGYVFVQFGVNHPGRGMTLNRFTENIYKRLDEAEMELVWEESLGNSYPNLYFGVLGSKVTVWIAREIGGLRRDGTATGYSFNLSDVDKTDVIHKLNFLQAEAKIAQQEDYFFCTKCQKTYHQNNYAFFYFSGEYCLKCKEENPDLYREAMSKSYN